MGHSMGGKYGLAFMILHPGFVKKLVLVDTDALVKDPWWTSHTTKRWFQPISAAQFKMLGNAKFLKIFANQIVEDKAYVPDEEVLIQEARLLSEPKQLEAIRAMNYHYPKLSMRATGLIERMDEVKNPTLIIWGRQDKIVNVSCADETKNALKNSRLHIYEKCGHLPFLEKMEHFNRMVLDFLDKE
jgi:4,5:9,10-diseco-3-hydroxy-5,9,17-trioxoandrosta-1(10),2-diene-4-oate hydrolase